MNDNEKMVTETLEEAGQYIDRFLDGLDSIAGSFLKGREDLALKDYLVFVEGLEWLMEVFRLTEPYWRARGIEFASRESVNQILTEIVEALENRDYVLVGDLMSYEIKPIVEKWNENFKLL